MSGVKFVEGRWKSKTCLLKTVLRNSEWLLAFWAFQFIESSKYTLTLLWDENFFSLNSLYGVYKNLSFYKQIFVVFQNVMSQIEIMNVVKITDHYFTTYPTVVNRSFLSISWRIPVCLNKSSVFFTNCTTILHVTLFGWEGHGYWKPSKTNIVLIKPNSTIPHCKKRFVIFPSQAGVSLTKLFLAGDNVYAPEAHIMYRQIG